MRALSQLGTLPAGEFAWTAQRDKRGSIIGPALLREIARREGVTIPQVRSLKSDEPLDAMFGQQGDALKVGEDRAERDDRLSGRVATLLGMERCDIWPRRFGQAAEPTPEIVRQRSDLSGVLASARAFRIAVDALPVGKDIRGRLLAHLDAHIAAIEAVR